MSVKTKIKTISWSLLGLCCVVLLVAAMKAKDSKACSNIEINIKGTTKHMFIKQTDVVDVLNKNTIHAGETLDEINLRKTEEQLKSNPWIKDAELFFDNHQILHVKISEREPVARVFTKSGESFYIDSSGLRLPVTENATARVIVFTSFPSDKKVLSKSDSLVLNDIKTITQYINADSFLNAQTAQINITSQRTYEITPVVGDQVIRIGNADNLDEKFSKLLAFYKQIFKKVGFERYSIIDVQYEGQVVAVRRGERRTVSDTTNAMRQLAKADTKLDRALKDTTYAAPMSKTAIIDSVNDLNDKNVTDDDKTGVRKPKAVMKKKV